MEKKYIIPKFKHMLHGGDYNPDQWQAYPEVLEEDMRLFKLANCNEMSLGIFAWAALEPEEGKFDFSFMDKAMDDIYKAGGRVILATPSAARPQWLAEKYPEVLRCNERFERMSFGRRHNHCYTSPAYREKTAIINTKLAERYKDHPALIAWHISNELSGECYCPLCCQAFRDWLKEKYGTLDNLNHSWWSTFWAHTYTDWNQILPPSPMGETSVHALRIDWRRFVSHQTADFMESEIATVKAITPDIPVTTNMIPGFYNAVDYRRLNKNVDFASQDMYPQWKGRDPDDANVAMYAALQYDTARCFKHKPFLLMESAPGLVNWFQYNKLMRPGVLEQASLQAVAHGADSAQYFQFRKSRGSAEKFHGAVVDHVGDETPRLFREVQQVGKRLAALDEIVGTMADAKIALVHDWSNKWAIDEAQGFQKGDKRVIPTLESFYKPLWKRGIDTDVIGFEDDFSPYSVIIAPMLYTVSEELGEKLKNYVKNGGTLLCTYMTAMVDENDLCHLGGFPGAGLKEVFGIWNEEIDTLYPEDTVPVTADGKTYTAVDYCEVIHARGAEVLATYDGEFYKGMPAATVNSYGSGKAYYLAFRDKGDFTDMMVERLLAEKNIASAFDGALPQGVTAHSRTDGDTTYLFLENFTASEQTLSTALCWTDVESGEKLCGTITLAPHKTVIIKK
ncbi:MAG: beta-galactosidase [Clostridia bacterium]|nr:beta-galactosidase [Clostridia bacterium]